MTPLALLLLLGSPLQGGTSEAPAVGQETIERQVAAMGTLLTLELRAAGRAEGLAASEAAIAAVERTEQCLSTWRTDSELAQFARTPLGQVQTLTPQLGAILERAFFWSRETGGAFDPSVAPLVAAWDLRGTGRRPSPSQLQTALARCGLEHFESALPGHLTRLLEEAGLEEGGFGKGAALDAAAFELAARGITGAVLDLGGQVLLQGTLAPQTFELAHPDRRLDPVVRLTLASGSFATSGNSERGLQVAGESIGHLLDARTGQPASDFGSVTVWCSRAIDADCLSTGLYVLGPQRGLQFAAEHEDVQALFLIRTDDALRLRATSGLRSQLSTLDPQLKIEWYTSLPQSGQGTGHKGS